MLETESDNAKESCGFSFTLGKVSYGNLNFTWYQPLPEGRFHFKSQFGFSARIMSKWPVESL